MKNNVIYSIIVITMIAAPICAMDNTLNTIKKTNETVSTVLNVIKGFDAERVDIVDTTIDVVSAAQSPWKFFAVKTLDALIKKSRVDDGGILTSGAKRILGGLKACSSSLKENVESLEGIHEQGTSMSEIMSAMNDPYSPLRNNKDSAKNMIELVRMYAPTVQRVLDVVATDLKAQQSDEMKHKSKLKPVLAQVQDGGLGVMLKKLRLQRAERELQLVKKTKKRIGRALDIAESKQQIQCELTEHGFNTQQLDEDEFFDAPEAFSEYHRGLGVISRRDRMCNAFNGLSVDDGRGVALGGFLGSQQKQSNAHVATVAQPSPSTFHKEYVLSPSPLSQLAEQPYF